MHIIHNIMVKDAAISGAKIVLNKIDNELTPYVTHFQDARGALHHGGYFRTANDAMNDFFKRK